MKHEEGSPWKNWRNDMFCVHAELFQFCVLCNNNSLTLVTIQQGNDCGGCVVRKIMKHFCLDSLSGWKVEPWTSQIWSRNVNRDTVVFTAFLLILYNWNNWCFSVSGLVGICLVRVRLFPTSRVYHWMHSTELLKLL